MSRKKEIKRKVIEKLKQGSSKQEVFDSLYAEYSDFKDYEIAEIIRNKPTTLCMERLKTVMLGFTVAIVIALAYKYYFSVNIFIRGTGQNHYYFIFPIVLSFLFIGVLAKDGKSILNVGFLGFFNIVAGIPLVMNRFIYIMIGDLLLTIVLIILSMYLSTKMFPKYEYQTIKGVNAKGRKQGKKVIRFIEKK